MIKKLMPCLKGYGKYAILTPLCVIVEVLLEVYIPFLMADIINVGITNRDINHVLTTGGIMVVLSIVSLAMGALSGRFAALGSTGFASGVRKKLFARIQEFSFANIDKFSTASLVTRLTTDVTNAQVSFMMVTRMLARAPVMLICATIMALRINTELATVFLIAIPVLAIALAAMALIAYPRFQAMLKKYDSMNGQVQENLIAIRVVKTFVRGDHETKEFNEAAATLRKFSLKAERVLVLAMPLMQFVVYACMIAILWFGGSLVIGGTMMTGDLMSFITYVMQILISLMMISFVFIGLVLSRASLTRIVEVLDEKIDITDENADPDLTVRDGEIEFDDVCFSYNKNAERLTLDHVQLQIRSGETVGIIGGTGSAKTTLVQLIPRLYDVNSGTVRVGGRDVRDYSLHQLRDSVAMVLQKNVLFSGTIRENLKWGDPNATDEQIENACRAAQAHDFIMSFPNGYDTDLGQGGVNVSGGQKQRLCIARALLKNPKIVIFDDSTSAVDTATDARIREAMRTQFDHVTTLIIAQRVSSVSDADKIIVLDNGRISAVGTHEELLRTNTIYREIYDSQQKGVA